jgi:hypothetical protein
MRPMKQENVFPYEILSCRTRPYMTVSHLLSGLPGTDPRCDRADNSSVAKKMTLSYTNALQNNCWFCDRRERRSDLL